VAREWHLRLYHFAYAKCLEARFWHRYCAGRVDDHAHHHAVTMANIISERHRTATFGPVAVTLATHGQYEAQLPGDNFGLAWRATRFYFPLEGSLQLGTAVVGARGAAVLAGTHPIRVVCDGAQVLEVDVAAERFEERDLLLKFKFATWAPESCLPSATAAALRELMERPGSTPEIRAETTRVVEALIASLLHVGQIKAEVPAVAAAPGSAGVAAVGAAGGSGAKVDIDSVMKLISRKYTDPALSPATIAGHFGVSLSTLYRCFEAEGISKALAAARVKAALDKLQDRKFDDYSLEEIAEKCGYRSPQALRRAVMQVTGQTPSNIRTRTPQ